MSDDSGDVPFDGPEDFAALGLQAISPTIIGANSFYEELTGESAPAIPS